jgi:catechol 2,3-dioxygenase-like lactoylglutathione lyase family enzyme
MARGLDHIVHAVRDLDAGAEFYRRLGFTVGARNRHPWGTHNHIVQMSGFFVEVLTLTEPEKLGNDGFSEHFGCYHRDFLAQREGLSCLVLESTDADADQAAFARDGIARSGHLTFSRAGTRPDGSAMTVGFSLVFARDPLSPDAAFAVCRQHTPDAFWNAAAQAHANTARAVLGVVLLAENPTDHHAFLAAYTGVRELHATSVGVSAATPRGLMEIMDPTAFRDRYGVASAIEGAGMHLAAVRIGVADRAATARCLQAGGVVHVNDRDRLIVAPTHAMGATLVFE